MCWRDPDELYNDGAAFKICCRDHRGVMVTVIADNYYGYCKKEVKTQISFAANLFGLSEEEHAGGAIAFATYVLGQEFYADRTVSLKKAILRAGDQPARRFGRTPAGRLRDRPSQPRRLLRPGGFRVHAARRFCPLAGRRPHAPTHSPPRRRLRPSFGFPHSPRKATLRQRLAAHRLAPARHAVPQTVHRFRRRQVGDLQVHQPTPC